MEIKNLDGEVLFAEETGSVAELIRKAVSAGKPLSGAYLSGAYLSGANLSGANLSGADLSGADLSGANLSGADLSGANLSGADSSGANLSGANLSGAYLSGANLSGANLSGADLSGANLSGAYLSGADLSGADLSGANLSGAYLSRTTGIDPRRFVPLLMLLEQPGPIRAYKLLTGEGESPFYTGKTALSYPIGSTVEVGDADTDPNAECSAGVNVCTLDWAMREWEPGMIIRVVEFTAKDIACIPTGTDGKFRLHRCKVVGEKDLVELGLVTPGKNQ